MPRRYRLCGLELNNASQPYQYVEKVFLLKGAVTHHDRLLQQDIVSTKCKGLSIVFLLEESPQLLAYCQNVPKQLIRDGTEIVATKGIELPSAGDGHD